ncbi:MAG: hypothetical protein JWO86_1843 [Myxococcaceae bacterium]|jgi:hypothetical protein|nr:hypothetical protein [Myxococcaceae bacterium]MEA2752887.1 hypothetical protein [Myxococcales bacterium]
MKTLLSLAALSFFSLAACASSTANDATLGSSASSSTAGQSEPAADLSGTWAFVLSASDVAAPIRERCAKSSNDDAAKAKACWSEIATQAAREKIRFANDTSGHTVWTSFESDGAKESVYVEVPVELAADGPGHVLAKVSGAPKGEQAASFAKSSINVMRIEVVDARTIAMTDPKKGRLVYSKE